MTVILPRRSFSPLLGRLLHDRTADKIAGVVSQVPNAAATIIPFDVQNRLRVLHERQAARRGTTPASLTPVAGPPADGDQAGQQARGPNPRPPRPTRAGRAAARRGQLRPADTAAGVTPIGSIHQPARTVVEGRVRVVEVRSVERNSVLACEISDSTGDLTALFYGRSNIPGLMCGSRVRFRGAVGLKHGEPTMINPAYELLVPYSAASHPRRASRPRTASRPYLAGKSSSQAGPSGPPYPRRHRVPRHADAAARRRGHNIRPSEYVE